MEYGPPVDREARQSLRQEPLTLRAPRECLCASARTGRLALQHVSRTGGRLGLSLRPVEVNGGPGALFLDADQRLISVVALDFAGGQITSISSIVNPDKLAHLGPVGDLRSLLKRASS